MPSRRPLPRFFALLMSAVLAAPIVSVTIGPSQVDAAGPYPTGPTIFDTNENIEDRFFANAGLADLTTTPTGPRKHPSPSSVTEVAGGSALQGAELLTSDLGDSPLGLTTLDSLHLEGLPIEIPLSTIPISRASSPRDWTAVLAPTSFAGIPLQTVTWKQVDGLVGAARPATLNTITLDEVDFSGSALRDLPLAALVVGGAEVTSIDIPLLPGEPASHTTNAQRWCYLINQGATGSCPSPASLTGQSLIEVGIQGAPLRDIPLRDIPLRDIDLSTSPLRDIPLRDIALQVAPLRDIPLRDINVEASPLRDIPLRDIAWATSPLRDIPLRDIAWATSPLRDIPLRDINLLTSPLRDIPLRDIDFGVAPLRDIPLRDIDLLVSPLRDIPLRDIDFGVAPLRDIPLRDINMATSPLRDIPLRDIALAGAPLRDIPLRDIAWATAPLRDIPLRDIDLPASGLGALPLDAVLWIAAPLATARLDQFTFSAGSALGTIPIASTTSPSAVAGCAAANNCPSGSTLASRQAAGDILATATLAAIGAAGFAGHGTLANLLAARTPTSTVDPKLADLRLDLAGAGASGLTLGPLVLALVPAQNPQLEDLRVDLVAGSPRLGDLRLDLLGAAAPATTVSELLDLLAPASADVTLGDLRIDLIAAPPAITLAAFIASLDATVPDVTLGDLRLDAATGVDALVLHAISGFLANPNAFDAYLLGALGTYTTVTGHAITLGELGTWSLGVGADITLGQLAQYLDDSVSLADVLLGLVPAGAFPFEDFPIASLGLDQVDGFIVAPEHGLGEEDADAPAGFNINPEAGKSFRFEGAGIVESVPFDLEVILPPGSIFTGAGADPNATTTTDPDGRVRVRARVPAIPSGGLGGTSITWQSGLRLGSYDLEWRMLDLDGTEIRDGIEAAEILVEDGAEPNTPIENVLDFDSRVPNFPTNLDGCSAAHADCTGLDPVWIDTMIPGFIDRPGDLDWYRLPQVRAGSRISAEVTNLPLDADVVLYGPAGIDVSPTLFPASREPLPGSLVEDTDLGVGQEAASIAAQALADLQLDEGYENPFDAPNRFPPLTPISISQHRSTDSESVGAIAPVSGDYVVAVTGYNGAHSVDPYLLRARVNTPLDEDTCAPRSFPNPTPAPSPAPTIGSSVNAVFLTHPGRLSATHGAAGASTVATELAELVSYLNAHPELGIVPAVVPLDAYADVRDAYAAWDANPCSVGAANAVATEITGVIKDEIRPAAPDLAYLTIVGGDDLVPMGRVPDLTRISNERDYAPTFGQALNPISAAQAASFTLTDDVYGDPDPVAIGGGGRIFVPQLSLGRLVETPDEIGGLLDAYTHATAGGLDLGTGLVAGYDFLADGADIIRDRLTVGARTIDGDLIDEPDAATPWDRADLIAKLFPSGSTPTPFVDAINAHYDHTALLPSAGNAGGSGELLTTANVETLGAGRLAGRVFFTMGCHAGLAVPDAYVPGSGPGVDDLRLDWAQTLAAGEVAIYVANTGFGIGDTASVAYSERLMGLYAKLLDGSLSAGEALTYAKQAYYGSLGAVGVYDLKILQQTAFYGLPFWRVGTAAPPAPPAPPALPAGSLGGTDSATGLQKLDFSVDPSFTEVETDRGSYWVVNGPGGELGPQVTQDRPILPRTSVSIVQDGLTAHGALITDLTSDDRPDVDPALGTPTIDLTASSPEVSTNASAWPARLATITNSVAPYGRAQDLVVIPGQFVGPTDGTGTQRLYESLDVRVLYASNAEDDFAGPSIAASSGIASGMSVDFSVEASDLDGPIERVVAAYRDFDDSWTFIELTETPTGPWTGSGGVDHPFGPADTVEYFIQAVDAAGNVTASMNKATGFIAAVEDLDAPTISATVSPAPNAAGWNSASSVTVTFSCADGGSGFEPDACPAPVSVSAQGISVVSGSVTDRAGNSATASATVRLDRTAPSLGVAVTPDLDAGGWTTADLVSVTFSCADDGGSGLAGPCPDPVSLTAEGSTPVSETITDVAGNSTSASVSIGIDRTDPVVAFTPTGAARPTGCSTNDPLSGVAAAAAFSSSTVRLNGIPVTTVTCSGATDQAGNTAAGLSRTFIAPITVIGFQSPVDNLPTVNTGTGGKTYPLKFQLKDPAGAFISTLGAVTSVTVQTVSCSTFTGTADALEAEAPGNSGLTYDPATNTYQYNWKTPKGKACYVIRVRLVDGTVKEAAFSLK